MIYLFRLNLYLFCLTCPDEPSNSAGSFEMIDNFEQDGFEKKDHSEQDNGLYDVKQENTYDAPSGVSPPASLRQPREEPEKIKKWREEQVKRLEEKDREEERKKEELREKAKKELEDWYRNHEETIAKTKAANRDAAK
ncbi:hypothetical protein ABEB36_004862 [Hypothenemus hampei]|uniref:Clathrin light chain n=1 Tax=Hypothenemus hampei TaxID=57062 RepID=A0ABD1EWP5_HYPHA